MFQSTNQTTNAVCLGHVTKKTELGSTLFVAWIMSSNTLLKPPMSFPRGPSDVNSQDSWDFAKVRHLGLFWQDDLCGKPFEKNETVGVWVRFPRNARQAVAVDLASCEALQGFVKRSMLSLHSLVSWFNADRAAATAVLEKALKAQSFRHLRILLRWELFCLESHAFALSFYTVYCCCFCRFFNCSKRPHRAAGSPTLPQL